MHFLQLLLGQHEAVDLLLSGSAWNGNTTHKRCSSLLLFLGLGDTYVTCESENVQEKMKRGAFMQRWFYLNEGGHWEGGKVRGSLGSGLIRDDMFSYFSLKQKSI